MSRDRSVRRGPGGGRAGPVWERTSRVRTPDPGPSVTRGRGKGVWSEYRRKGKPPGREDRRSDSVGMSY